MCVPTRDHLKCLYYRVNTSLGPSAEEQSTFLPGSFYHVRGKRRVGGNLEIVPARADDLVSVLAVEAAL